MVPDPNIVAAKVFVLPQIREFTGSENDYTAEEYISLCDDVMKTCYITQDTCKISFVRSRLQIGSRPAKMMSTRIFTDPEKNKDYDSFRTKFLRIFGSKKAPHSLVQGIINAVDVFLSDTPPLNMFEGQVEANRLSTEFIQYIKDNGWNEGEYISLQNNHKFMEFFIFMILMRGTCRGSAWSLKYKPTDELHEFVQKLRKNREENGQIGKAVRTVNVTCQYCQRKGHTISRCSLREKDERGSRKAEAADDPRSHTRRGARRNTAYCTFHQCIGHSTDECYSVINLGKKMRKKRGSGGSQPGEAARPIQYSQYRNNSRK
ncbi:uncharacterized protein LOC123518237 isoform X1 [Portunus trituberculatus]|uniref:uncharacterized protein LOC123518237 isoform X1 n=1 Tax=Portunus trituberculatus TaxID=210409 RepID=UPI001E1D1059|nr:uncharacterized protein LOC123518237 isoform X1 [Portunus trituberculatus]XP_045134895.1 uncharacterized protein LOC123518237 isoform X1 [Portunus trituberculatus]